MPHFRDANCVQILNKNDIVIGGGHLTNDNIQSIYRSFDNGLSWNVQRDVAITSNMINTIYFKDSINGIAGGISGEIVRTSDAGTTWQSSFLLLNRDIKKIIDFNNELLLVGGNSSSFGSHQSVFSSIDNGNSWVTKRDTSLPSLNSVTFFSGTLFAVGDSGYLLKSNDFGNTWAKQNLPLVNDYKQIKFISSTTGFIVGGFDSTYSTILKTTDAGNTWNVVVSDTGAMLNDIAFVTATKGFAVGFHSKIYTTNDGGNSWSLFSLPSFNTKQNLTAISFYNNDFGFITSASGYAYVYSIAPKPAVFTVEAQLIDSTSAVFKAACKTYAFSGNLSFVFDTSPTFPNLNETFPQAIKSDSIVIASTGVINGLLPNTLYYLYSKLSTIGGDVVGDTIRFYTGTPYSKFFTLEAVNATSTSVKLKGEVEKLQSSTNLFFEYGTSPSSFTTISANPSSIGDSLHYIVSVNLTNLIPQTFYYFRLKGIDANGVTIYGSIKTFFTGAREIPNWDFQYWQSDTVQLPNDWNFANGNIGKGTNNGSNTLVITGQNIVINGEIGEDGGNNSGPKFYGGNKFNHRPDSVKLRLKYNIVSSDTAFLLVYMYKSDTVIANPFYRLAVNNSNNTFVDVTFPIEYYYSSIPDSIVMGMVSFNPFNQINNDSSKYNSLEIDTILFIENTQTYSLPNFGFEKWYSYAYNKLETWEYLPFFSLYNNTNPFRMVEQDTFRNSNDYCAVVQNIPTINASYRRGEISTGSNFIKDHGPSFPVNYKHLFLNGYYKFFPQNGDTMEVQLTMYELGQQVGFASFLQADTVSGFSPLNIPIYYNNSNVNPDSASLKISAARRNANGHSVLYIDKLNFDGLVEDVDDTTAIFKVDDLTDSITIFPNPNHGYFKVVIPENIATFNMSVFDINGRKLYELDKINTSENYYSMVLSEGCYFVVVRYKDKLLTKKIVVF